MVYITGDIHGDVQHIRDAIAKYNITENDIIVILGDVGMNYYGRHGDRQRKKKLNKLGVPILCIHGNHEMRPDNIPTYLKKDWNGGVVFYEKKYPNLLFAIDGEIYNLGGQITIGSDCHYAEKLDVWYDEAVNYLKTVGFKTQFALTGEGFVEKPL
jgi:3-oxoacid CoA-transferase subunit A